MIRDDGDPSFVPDRRTFGDDRGAVAYGLQSSGGLVRHQRPS